MGWGGGRPHEPAHRAQGGVRNFTACRTITATSKCPDLRTPKKHGRLNRVWAVRSNTPGASDRADCVDSAQRGPFHLAGPAALHPRYRIRSPPHGPIRGRRLSRSHRRRPNALVMAVEPLQAERKSNAPKNCLSATSEVGVAAPAHLTDRRGGRVGVGAGVQRRVGQFVCGFDIVGASARPGLFPTCLEFHPCRN